MFFFLCKKCWYMHREPLEEELLSLGKRARESDEKGRIFCLFFHMLELPFQMKRE